jgi:cell division initiation protein
MKVISVHDIINRKFEKALHGYKVEDVNQFMSLLEIDYEKLMSENAMLKNKIGILVDKITEYKEIEQSLRGALSSAQKMSESILNEARRQADSIIDDANNKSERILNTVNLQIISEKRKLEEIKRETHIFKERLTSLYKSQIGMLSTIPDFKVDNLKLSDTKELINIDQQQVKDIYTTGDE